MSGGRCFSLIFQLMFFCAVYSFSLLSTAEASTYVNTDSIDIAGINRLLHDPVLKKDLRDYVRNELQSKGVNEKRTTPENWTGRWLPESTTAPNDAYQQQLHESTSTSGPHTYVNSVSALTDDSLLSSTPETWTGRWFPESTTTMPPSTADQQFPEGYSSSVPSSDLSRHSEPQELPQLTENTDGGTVSPFGAQQQSSYSLLQGIMSSLFSTKPEESWTGRWFPESTTAIPHISYRPTPDYDLQSSISSQRRNDSLMPREEEAWTGRWFPESTTTAMPHITEQQLQLTPDYDSQSFISSQLRNNSLMSREKESWTGRWLPEHVTSRPNVHAHPNLPNYETTPHLNPNSMWNMINSSCDDGKTNLTVDWDGSPVNYTCFDPHNFMEPNYDIPDVIIKSAIPKLYKAKHECMNRKIEYQTDLPTFGTHRPAWPRYGEYKFLPVQRWLHSLEHGAVVMLYHPCAHPALVNELKEMVTSCLYRHIITPYTPLSPDRPMALLTWGWALLMSLPDKPTVSHFIRNHALHGPEAISKDGQFSEGLITPAKVITDINDSTDVGLCSPTLF